MEVFGAISATVQTTESLRQRWWQPLELWMLAMMFVQPLLALAAWPATYEVEQRNGWMWL
jgi:hypothetical protein